MRLDRLGVSLRVHAYAQYCERVQHRDWKDVYSEIVTALKDNEYYRDQQFVDINGVWWVAEVEEPTMTVHFVTCYGRLNYDLPAAVRWQDKHKDRVVSLYDGQTASTLCCSELPEHNNLEILR